MSEEVDYAEARNAAQRSWARKLESALKSDGWGQVIEAVEAYDELGHVILSTLDRLDPPASDRAFLNKTLVCLTLRSKLLSSAEDVEGPRIEQMQRILPALKLLFKGPTPPFPVDIKEFGAVAIESKVARKGLTQPEACVGVEPAVMTRPTARGASSDVLEHDDVGHSAAASASGAARSGTLLPCPRLIPGQQFLSFDIEKIGLKDAETYVDPYFTISVYDVPGRELGLPQDTPISNKRAEFHVLFNCRVFIQTPLRELMDANAAIFFEFKHYKPREKRISVRCWSLVEMDEVKEGPVLLEIYKKPIDVNRRKIKTHSVKPLFLHVRMALHSL